MNRQFFLFAFLCLSIALEAQITVTNSTFPQVGDTLNLAVHANPAIQITAPGGPYTWDYSGLEALVDQQIIFRPASEGSIAVSGATMFAGYPGGIENYYSSSANAFLLLAVKGPVGQVFGVESVFHYSPPRVERSAPLNYQDVNSFTSNLLVPFSTENIPSEIIDSLGLPVVPDSIRLRIASQLTSEVDAYGTVQLPDGDFEALRVKRTEALDTRVDVLLPFFGWQDVTDVLLSGGLIPGIGNDTIVTYQFLSDTEKEVLVEASMDSTGQNVQQVIFKNGDAVNAAKDRSIARGELLRLYPNPFSDVLNFEARDQLPGALQIQFFTADGSLVKTIDVTTSSPASVNLAGLPVGSVLFKLVNDRGEVLQSGKLIKQ